MFGLNSKVVLEDIDNRLLFRRGYWFVRTRELPEKGPFETRLEAVEGLYRHVAICSGGLNASEHRNALAFIRHSVRTCSEPECGLCADLMRVAHQDLPCRLQDQLKA